RRCCALRLGVRTRIRRRCTGSRNLEMMLEVGFTQPARKIASVIDRDVGLDALCLDRSAIGGVVARRGELQTGVVSERQDGLDGAFAESLRTHDNRTLVVL